MAGQRIVKLVECVPNFSEGRRPEVLQAILAPVQRLQGVRVLEYSLDADHHRAVATLAGEPASVAEAAFRVIREACERIDLTRQRGVHPRMGSTDVCPFIPLRGACMADCVELAHGLGARVGDELGIPVYYYAEAALRPERRELPRVRRAGFEELARHVGRDPAYAPDAGPARLHPTAGATAIGARSFLIAFNVNLESTDLGLARAIARSIRESNGGLPGIRALGFALEGERCVQVSMNVCAPERTGLVAVFETIQGLAQGQSVAIRESEIVGMAPSAALDDEIAARIRLKDYDRGSKVIEAAL